ncbi:MAG TPA: family 10 glycosylhydrolase [Bacilli bacterium]|nr:family 10 glycosylhydrolase [Bacilli bacterium]
MKKILIIILVLFIGMYMFYYMNKKEDNNIINNFEEDRYVFISYIDYSYLKGKDENILKEEINKMVLNIKENNFNGIILQVRAFSDAIYYSKIFSPSLYIVNNENDKLKLDMLDYFIKLSHENNIKLIAWINPYRIRSNNDISSISGNNIVNKYLNTSSVEVKNGIYFNPAKDEVLDLIIKGVLEIVKNYDVDGILYDDYFYPSKTCDLNDYKLYKLNGGLKSLEDFRRDNINKLIRKTYEKIKEVNSDVLFGISPSGNMNNNYNAEYLDINYLIENKIVDFIMPQIYYGFDNTNLPFVNTVNSWSNLVKDTNIKFYVALALYKSGLEDKYAKTGINEWINNNDIISKQIIVSRNTYNYEGFSIFRYDYLFNSKKDNKQLLDEVFYVKKLLKNKF